MPDEGRSGPVSRAPGGPQVREGTTKRPHAPLNTLYGSGVPRGDPSTARYVSLTRCGETNFRR